MPVGELSIGQARRIALTAQGFGLPRPSEGADLRHLRRMFDYVGLIRLDDTSTRLRAEEVVVFSRLGPHPRGLLSSAHAAGDVFEYWGNGAALIPSEQYPLLRWKMERAADGTNWSELAEMQRATPWFVDDVLNAIEEHGPIGEDEDLDAPWWNPEDGRRAIDFLFWSGRLAAYRQDGSPDRTYDVPERVIPRQYLDLPVPPEATARKQLLLIAARAHGIASASDLADYHGQLLSTTKPLLDELVEDGQLAQVAVRDWRPNLYLHPEAELPGSALGTALLSPTDSLLWSRQRATLLFDFPAREDVPPVTQRSHVLPFLLNGEIVARVEIEFNPARQTIHVHAAEEELGAPIDDVADALVDELRDMAEWLGVAEFDLGQKGELMKQLARNLRGY